MLNKKNDQQQPCYKQGYKATGGGISYGFDAGGFICLTGVCPFLFYKPGNKLQKACFILRHPIP